jgi:hypothetical protein
MDSHRVEVLPGKHQLQQTQSTALTFVLRRSPLGAKRQCEYTFNAFNLCELEQSIPQVSMRVRRDMQNHTATWHAPDYQVFSVH